MNRKRDPKGIPTGGEFATEGRAESSVELVDHAGSITEEAGVPSLAPFLRQAAGDWGGTVEEMDAQWAGELFYEHFYDSPQKVANELMEYGHDPVPMTDDEALAHIESFSGQFPRATELVRVAFDRDELPADRVHALNPSTAEKIEHGIAEQVQTDIEMDMADGSCRSCGVRNDDGEGSDGLCGNCADREEGDSDEDEGDGDDEPDEVEEAEDRADSAIDRSLRDGAQQRRIASDPATDRLTSIDADEAYRTSALGVARAGFEIGARLRAEEGFNVNTASLEYQQLLTTADTSDFYPVIGAPAKGENPAYSRLAMVATPMSTTDSPDGYLRVVMVNVDTGEDVGAFTMAKPEGTSVTRAQALAAM